MGYPTSSPIPCYNRFEALSDIDESDWFSCELNYEKLSGSRMREASFQGDNEESDWSSRVFDCEELFGSQSQRYSANRYPLSRKHQRQMIRRKMRKTKKTHRQQDIEGSGRSSRAFDCEELSVPLSVRNKEVPVPLSVRKEEMPVQKKEVPVPVRKKEVIIQKEGGIPDIISNTVLQ